MHVTIELATQLVQNLGASSAQRHLIFILEYGEHTKLLIAMVNNTIPSILGSIYVFLSLMIPLELEIDNIKQVCIIHLSCYLFVIGIIISFIHNITINLTDFLIVMSYYHCRVYENSGMNIPQLTKALRNGRSTFKLCRLERCWEKYKSTPL